MADCICGICYYSTIYIHRVPCLGHSIVINGETGSGKTEMSRSLIRHLLEHSGAGLNAAPVQAALAERITHANVLLESLGNARLCRNYNSR